MSELQCPTQRNGNQDLFSKIESVTAIVKIGWNDLSAHQNGLKLLTDKANAAISLVDYLESKMVFEYTHSSTGWTHKTSCPFHKGGHERTPSFFVNPDINRYFCQACHVSGGIVEYIAAKKKLSTRAVAEHILRCVNSGAEYDPAAENKIKERQRINKALISLSKLCYTFVQDYKDDDEAIAFAQKCMRGFDSVHSKKKHSVEKSIEDIVKQIELHFTRYRNT